MHIAIGLEKISNLKAFLDHYHGISRLFISFV